MSKWTKCSEQLPQNDGNYLVTNGYGEVHEVTYAEGWNCSRRMDGTVMREYECKPDFIVAWMVMPSAYEED